MWFLILKQWNFFKERNDFWVLKWYTIYIVSKYIFFTILSWILSNPQFLFVEINTVISLYTSCFVSWHGDFASNQGRLCISIHLVIHVNSPSKSWETSANLDIKSNIVKGRTVKNMYFNSIYWLLKTSELFFFYFFIFIFYFFSSV